MAIKESSLLFGKKGKTDELAETKLSYTEAIHRGILQLGI